MSMVQQTPDGHLIVRTATQVYLDTGDNGALDFGVATPSLPTGAIDRIYDQGVRHVMTDGFTTVSVGPMPWVAGDSYVNNVAAALANQSQRQQAQLRQVQADFVARMTVKRK